MKLSALFAAFFLLATHECHSYRILFLLPFSGKSHYMNIRPIIQELDRRGHEPVVIAPYRENNVNYTQITTNIMMLWEALGMAKDRDLFHFTQVPPMVGILFCQHGVTRIVEHALETEALQRFIDEDRSHFDLIFTELFYQEAFYMFAHKYKAPMVGLSTTNLIANAAAHMGNPIMVSYVAHEYFSYDKDFTFAQRLANLGLHFLDYLVRTVYQRPKQQALAEKHFASLPQPLPTIDELEKNISLAFINTHFSYNVPKPYVPTVIEVAGVHIQQPKKLPDKIQKFLDEAEHGAVFFSFGSNLKSKQLPKDKLEVFLAAFRRLKQRVVWKWEDENIPNIPENVMVGPWLPQNDILAHPNIRLFITHGGMLSTQEAMYHGVPMIGFPIYGDQFMNVQRIERQGLGVGLNLFELTLPKMEAAFEKVLRPDGPALATAREVSKRFRDRPQTPMNETIFWIEYAIRHKGAPFMRSPAADLSWYVQYMFDMAALATIALLVMAWLAWRILRRAIASYRKKEKKEVGKKEE